MRVCHITSVHNSTDVRIFEKECTSLAKIGLNEVFLVAPGKSYVKNNVTIVGLGDRPQNRIKRFFFYSQKACKEALKVDADIYHFHDPEILFFVKRLKQNNKKVIFDSHEDYYRQIQHKEYIPKICRRVIAYLYRMIENKACKYLDAAIFPCEINGVHPFAGRVKQYEFINNTPIISTEVEDNREISSDKKDVVCCVGTLTRDRGIEVLIDACYQLDIQLILAGDISDEFRKQLMSKKSYNIVDYRGICNRDEVKSILMESTIGASNILWEGQYPYINNLPTKVYEYMMAGIPYIISNFPYSKEVIEKYKCGIAVEPGDVENVMKGIRFLMNHKEKAVDMGNNGKKAVYEELNWSVEEDKLYLLYNMVNK